MLRLQMDLEYEQRHLGRNQQAAFLCEELQKLHEEPQPSDLGYSDDNVQRVWALVFSGAHMHQFALCDHITFKKAN